MAISPIAAAARATPAAAPTPPEGGRAFSAVLEGRRAPAPPSPHPAPPGPSLAHALGDVERARARLDAVLHAARGGRTFTAQELLGLQAEAYRYTQAVDLAAKVVESGAQSVKQAVNTQV